MLQKLGDHQRIVIVFRKGEKFLDIIAVALRLVPQREDVLKRFYLPKSCLGFFVVVPEAFLRRVEFAFAKIFPFFIDVKDTSAGCRRGRLAQ
jgi:hypothetical protein